MNRSVGYVVAVAACIALAPASAPARPLFFSPAAPMWKIFTPGNAFSVFYGIVQDAQHDVWVADNTDQLLFRFDRTGHVQSYSVSPFQPNQVTIGADGAFYLNSSSQTSIARFTRSGGVQTFPIPSGDPAFGGMALGPDGKVWFTEQSHVGSITTTGVITEYPLHNLGVAGGGVARGHDGNMWFAGVISGGPAMISKINPMTGHIVTYKVEPRMTCYPEALAEGPFADVWFNCASSLHGGLGRITTDGRYRVYYTTFGPTFAPQAIAFGPDKALWYLAGSSSGAILGRFDVARQRFTSYNGPPGSAPQWGITFDGLGNIWTSCTSHEVDEIVI